jgi:anthranilate/para-aminobenzoate synthase component I
VLAGAGVVADSVPEREAAEVAAKAASMLAAIGAEVPA